MPSLTYPSDIVRNEPDVGDDVFSTNGRLSSDVRSKPIARRLTYFKMGIIFRFFFYCRKQMIECLPEAAYQLISGNYSIPLANYPLRNSANVIE